MLSRLSVCSAAVFLLASGYNSYAFQQSRAAGVSSYRELQIRLNEQKQATDAGDSLAVAETSRKLSAVALLEMARSKKEERSWAQAADLYKQSLAIDDRADARSELATITRTPHKAPTVTPSQLQA